MQNEQPIRITEANRAEITEHLSKDPNFSCDTETYGLEYGKGAFMVGFGHIDGTTYDVRDTDPNFKGIVQRIVRDLDNDNNRPIFANAKFDIHRLNWLCGKMPFKYHHDVITADKLLDPKSMSHKLKLIGSRLYGDSAHAEQDEMQQWFDEHNNGEKEFWKVPDEIIGKYFRQDLQLTRRIGKDIIPNLKNYHRAEELYNTECQLAYYVAKMEERGIPVDIEYLAGLQEMFEEYLIEADAILRQAFNVGESFNFNSSDQLSELLYNTLGFPVTIKTKSNAPSVADEALALIDHPMMCLLRNYAKLHHALANFIIPWQEFGKADGLLHADFNQNGAVSGRFTCSKPNMQQIIKYPIIMRALLVRPGFITGHSDLNQIELVGAAWYSRDPIMLDAVRQRKDLHSATASVIYDRPIDKSFPKERGVGKGMNFSKIYGCGKARLNSFLSKYAGMLIDKKISDEAYAAYDRKFPAIGDFNRKVMHTIRMRPDRIIRNHFGRRYYIPPYKEYIGFNRIVQGWAADLTKLAMLRIAQQLDWKNQFMTTQVHDMIGWECPKEMLAETQEIVETAMRHGPEFDVPIDVDTTLIEDSWEHCKD